MDAKNIDDVLIKAMRPQEPQQEVVVPEVSNPAPDPPVDPAIPPPADEYLSTPEIPGNSTEVPRGTLSEKKHDDSPSEKKPESSSDSPIDEYGNPVAKPKMYTEEEVQKAIRDRLARVKTQQQPQMAQEVRKASEDFKADPASDDSWEVQLESFIEKTIEKRQTRQTEQETRQTEQEWRQQESRRQAEYEARFTAGMGKYQDFNEVVQGKPITDQMMLATRSLENPAAFIYAASKMHPREIDRISRMDDPWAISAEVGRLHERMVKERKVLSQAAKPLETPKGDMPSKTSDRPSIEFLIAQHAKQKLARGR